MPKYKIGISRKPTSVSFSTTVTARTPAEAMQKAQMSHKNDIVISAEPMTFKVNIARKPSKPERYIELVAFNPQDAANKIEQQHRGFVAIEVLEIRDRHTPLR